MNNLKLIEISGGGCAGCQALMPNVNAVANQNGLAVEHIDLEANPSAAQKYSIERLPAVILADGERVIASCFGYQPEEILSLWVEAKLEEYSGGAKG